jgi:PAS domain S-box-containing protein
MFHSLKGKVLSIYIFLILLICFIAAISVYNLYNLNKAIDGLIESNYRSIVAATNMINAIERQDSSQLIYLQVNESKGLEAFIDNEKEFFVWLSKANDNITEKNEQEIITNISNSYEEYLQLFSTLKQIKFSNEGKEEATNFYDNKISPVFQEIKKACIELSDLNENAMFNSKNKAKMNSEKQMYMTIIISVLLISLGLLVAFYFTNRMIKPMNMLITGIKSIKEGNLDQEIQVSTKDEIGQLASEFNNMTERLLKYEKTNINNLIAEKNKSLAIVKSISDLIIVTNSEYKITLVNKAAEEIFGINEEEVIGMHFLEAINDIDIFNKIKKYDKDKLDSEEDLITIFKEESKYYYLTITSILNEEGYKIGTVSVFQDVTHMKKIEQIKSDFISTVSHELRTPLTSIIMGVGLLLDGTSGELKSEQKEIIRMIEEDGNRIMVIINDLLDLSKIESGKIINLEKISIFDLVEKCLSLLIDIAKEKQIKVFNEITQNIPPIYADSKKTTYILNNLIVNAIKFTDKGGEVRVTAEIEEEYLKISVIDTGIGIPNDRLKDIFEKYTQIWDENTSNDGTGLGLAITKEFVNKQNGDIWVQSKQGEGSKFIFTVPLYKG